MTPALLQSFLYGDLRVFQKMAMNKYGTIFCRRVAVKISISKAVLPFVTPLTHNYS